MVEKISLKNWLKTKKLENIFWPVFQKAVFQKLLLKEP